MKRVLYLLTAVSLSAGAAAPALAGDLLYPGGSMLSEPVVGKPYWAVQARCAGLYGAASNYLSEKGDPAGAEAAKQQGVAFFKDAVDRLMKDRGVERTAAMAALTPSVQEGRAEGLASLTAEGAGTTSKFNYARSLCLDVADVYHGVTPE